MALIECPECGQNVSERAPTCPNCGAPILKSREEKSINTKLNTIQQTSKRLKSHVLISSLMMIIGFILLLPAICSSSNSDSPSAVFYIALPITIAGLAWLIFTKLRIWWHHK